MQLKLDWSPMQVYTAENVDKHAPVEGGVYKIAQSVPGLGRHVCYVGQAENLRERLRQHLLPSEPNERLRTKVENLKCWFGCATTASQEDREGAERALYDHFESGWLVNDTVPSGAPAEINFD